MDQFALKEKTGVNYMLLELTGSLNSYTIAELQEKLFEYIADTNVVLDASQITQVDYSGVGVILAGYNDAESFGNKLFIMNPSETIKRALERTGFFDMFHIIHSVTEVSDD